MRVEVHHMLWHAKEPVLSVDFSPTEMRLATGGVDKTAKVKWQLLCSCTRWRVRAAISGAVLC
jgi:WD40 repeat protein